MRVETSVPVVAAMVVEEVVSAVAPVWLNELLVAPMVALADLSAAAAVSFVATEVLELLGIVLEDELAEESPGCAVELLMPAVSEEEFVLELGSVLVAELLLGVVELLATVLSEFVDEAELVLG